MAYILIVLLTILLILLGILIKRTKNLISKVEDIKLDVQILVSKSEQLLRRYEVLNSKLQDAITRLN